MGRVFETLWDLLGLSQPEKPRTKTASRKRPDLSAPAPSRATSSNRSTREIKPALDARHGAMQSKYDAMVEAELARHGVRVRRWRTSMSGIAWQIEYRDGAISRLIEAPRPKGPMSAAVFLHEIGHHAIGFNVYKPRCLEEYHAWAYALREMESHGLNITESVLKRRHNSLKYALDKARRRGLKSLPAELEPYQQTYAPPRRDAITP
jgi:hypothetical protein